MESVSSMNTRQITIMSQQIFEQNARINELHKHIVLIGTQVQHTQSHVSRLNARVPAFKTCSKVLTTIVSKVNELVLHVRAMKTDDAARMETERILLADLEAINMELGMGDLLPQKGSDIVPCTCEWNTLCDVCFPA